MPDLKVSGVIKAFVFVGLVPELERNLCDSPTLHLQPPPE